ncbi:MAG: hypothetical protein J6C16_03700 [Clostridia bacterium]|nr:hypothetical protein [Clostridia bacterium]
MADKTYKLKDIPKGQKLAHIWEYYRWHIVVAIALVLSVVSLVVQNLNKEKYDSYMLFTMSGGYVTEETRLALEEGIEELDIDNNGDSYSNLYISNVLFPEDMLDPTTAQEAQVNMQKLIAELTAGECIIQITDDKIYETLERHETLATYESLDGLVEGEGVIKIPYNETKLEDIVPMEEFGNQLYVTLRPGDTDNVIYRDQIEVFKKLLK